MEADNTYVPKEQVPNEQMLNKLTDLVKALKEHEDATVKNIASPSIIRYALQHGDIERWFKYHPPETDERKKAHEEVNYAALQMAKCVMMYMPDPEYQLQFFQQIQLIRMMLNQTITIMELDGISIPEVD